MSNVEKERINFIPEERIFTALKKAETATIEERRAILEKAKDLKGLSIEESALLLVNVPVDEDFRHEIYETAKYVKQMIYGKRIVLFAPLYLSNDCANICAYCGFRSDNRELKRKTLTKDELIEEVKILEEQGQKRLLLVYAENPKYDIDWMVNTIETVYNVKKDYGEIRRVNINSAPLSVEDFIKLKEAGIGTYQCFQETYHKETYEKVHIAGKKADFFWRLYALDRAQQAGIDDVAMGVLFGLYDFRFEVLALLAHAEHLEQEFGVGPHTISFPRIEPALGADLSQHVPYPVDDDDFKLLVSVLRMAVPYTGLILTTRETPEMRREVINMGSSQISAGSRTYPGGYRDQKANLPDKQQFTIGDERPMDEVIRDLLRMGFIPSFCTACYRVGRTGDDFMKLAKTGIIQRFCDPNALLTIKEYLIDYASEETRKEGEKLIEKQIEKIPEEIRADLKKKLKMIEEGKRDLYY